jgi:tetratricopeptide (TPR) repeat protein
LRHDDAIASATRLLELGNWFVADAYYWRAWNQARRDLIPAARADVDRAKALTATAPTLILSGIIGWREKRLEFAEGEFQAALNLDFGQCEAAFYLGGVRAEQQEWPESLAAFQHAVQCFELSIATRRKAIAELTGLESGTLTTSRQIASHERAIVDAEVRRAEAGKNVASIQRYISANSR